MTTTKTQTTTFQMTESQMKDLVRNALLVAGQEMGETGDHWPVIKKTIKDVMLDWEQLRIEREVHAEMRSHLYQQLAAMEQVLLTCTSEDQKLYSPKLAQLREVYDAFFTRVENEEVVLDDELYLADIEKPIHIRRAEAIIETLEEETDHA